MTRLSQYSYGAPRRRGEGLTLRWGWAPTPFGNGLFVLHFARHVLLLQTLRQGQRINFDLDADGRAIKVRFGSEVDMGLPSAQV